MTIRNADEGREPPAPEKEGETENSDQHDGRDNPQSQVAGGGLLDVFEILFARSGLAGDIAEVDQSGADSRPSSPLRVPALFPGRREQISSARSRYSAVVADEIGLLGERNVLVAWQ